MKHYKPGQFITYGKKKYRAKKAIAGCVGCVLQSVVLCPNIVCVNSKKPITIPCAEDNIILVNV